MGLVVSPVEHPGQWALRIAEAYGASEYVNPIGGQSIFDKAEFDRANIRLTFLKHRLPSYKQCDAIFEPGLSILDVLLFLSQENVLNYLSEYDLM